MVCELSQFYVENLRNILFTGLLTIGTFIFAVKTFIVIKLKEDVFDTEYYRERLRKNRKLSPNKKLSHYGPLKNLTTVLFYASVISLTSAVLQVTVGLIGSPWSTIVCILFALASITLLFISMIFVKMSLNVWLEDLEHQARKSECARKT